jgi:hypothetical protein
VALVRERTIPTERPPLVGEVSANFCGYRGVAWSVRRIPYGRNLGFPDLAQEHLVLQSETQNITIIILDIIHRHVFRLKQEISAFRWNLPSWAKQIELVSVSGNSSSLYWVQLSGFHLKTGAESNLRNNG